MKTVYAIALDGNPVSYFDGCTCGDPSRTCLIERAKKFSDFNSAEKKMKSLIKAYPNRKSSTYSIKEVVCLTNLKNN